MSKLRLLKILAMVACLVLFQNACGGENTNATTNTSKTTSTTTNSAATSSEPAKMNATPTPLNSNAEAGPRKKN